MGVDITMPQLSDTMHEGTILTWFKQVGDVVKRGEALAEVATDKADLEIESFHEGTLVQICAPKGSTVKVGTIIAVIGEKGEATSAAPQGTSTPQVSQPVLTPQQKPVSVPVQPAVVPPTAAPMVTNGHASPSFSDGERIKISPLAKNLAKAHSVDYSALSGSGEGGRIVKRDIERALGRELPGPSEEAAPVASYSAPIQQPVQAKPFIPATPAFSGEKSTEALSKMRQTIAARMVESATTIPHFYATSKVNVGALKKLKASLKPLPQYDGLTFNHLIVRAAAMALKVVPRINCSYHDGRLVQPQSINIGIITAVPDGLLIPVVKNVDQMQLADITQEARGLVQRARSGRPKADDLVGGTFSISNMGIFDVESFTAIISPGQGSILAVSPIQEEPVVMDGKIEVGSVMRLTLSVDHRIIDGVMSGEFLTEIKRLLEDPVLLLA